MDGNCLNVLLIEDILTYSSLLKRILLRASIVVDTADNLEIGLQMAAMNTYQAVLLDLGLPDSQGLNTFIKFKAHCPDLPVIIFTGSDDEQLQPGQFKRALRIT